MYWGSIVKQGELYWRRLTTRASPDLTEEQNNQQVQSTVVSQALFIMLSPPWTPSMGISLSLVGNSLGGLIVLSGMLPTPWDICVFVFQMTTQSIWCDGNSRFESQQACTHVKIPRVSRVADCKFDASNSIYKCLIGHCLPILKRRGCFSHPLR